MQGRNNDPNDPAKLQAQIKEANSTIVNLRLEYEKCLVSCGAGLTTQGQMGCVCGGVRFLEKVGRRVFDGLGRRDG
jgi:hypothetical protein